MSSWKATAIAAGLGALVATGLTHLHGQRRQAELEHRLQVARELYDEQVDRTRVLDAMLEQVDHSRIRAQHKADSLQAIAEQTTQYLRTHENEIDDADGRRLVELLLGRPGQHAGGHR